MAGKYTPPPLVDEVVRKFEDARTAQSQLMRDVDRRYRAYRGIMSLSSEASKWRNQYHAPYIFQAIETQVASSLEENLKFSVKPSPKVNMSMEEAMQALDAAKAVELALRHEHKVDDFDQMQRPYFLQDAIAGWSVGKCFWAYHEGPSFKQVAGQQPVYDDQDNLLFNVPTLDVQETVAMRDGPGFEVVPVEDFFWHESAKTLQPWKPGGAQHVIHRCWYSMSQLREMEKYGVVSNLDQVSAYSLDFSDEYASRYKDLWNMCRTKDLIEVLEYWGYENGKVVCCWVANRTVLIRDKQDNPFWHGQYPFVIAASKSDLFRIPGISTVELLEHVQEMLWKLENQTFDNVELINNAITLIRSDIDDPDAFEYAPGARWRVEDPKQVDWHEPPYQIAELAMNHIGMLKGDLQTLSGSAPFMGANTQGMDQKTATGVSIVTNLAQKELAARKYQAMLSIKDKAEMDIKLLQQFVKEDRLVHMVGPNGVPAFMSYSPLEIQGDYVVDLEAMGESQMRQERRAEAMALGQLLLNAAQIAAVSGTPINIQEAIKYVLQQYDIEGAERFFLTPNNAGALGQALQGGGGGGSPAQQTPAPGQPTFGVTAESAVDASSPSATGGVSISPVAALQQFGAASGGGRSA